MHEIKRSAIIMGFTVSKRGIISSLPLFRLRQSVQETSVFLRILYQPPTYVSNLSMTFPGKLFRSPFQHTQKPEDNLPLKDSAVTIHNR